MYYNSIPDNFIIRQQASNDQTTIFKNNIKLKRKPLHNYDIL